MVPGCGEKDADMTSGGVESIEVRGKTIELAIEKGLEELGLIRSRVQIEVVYPGSRGVLGIGAEDAVVRLTPRGLAAPPSEPAERRPDDLQTEEEAEAGTPAREAEIDSAPAPLAAPEPLTAPEPAAVTEPPPGRQPEPEVEERSDEEVAALAQGLLSELLGHLGVEAEVQTHYAESEEGEEAPLMLDVVGKDLGILIGRRGDTLAALQFLLRLMVNSHTRRWMNLVVDVEGYKARRELMLKELALRMADRAMATGRVVALEAMPARERRIVHLALRDHPDVSTQSIGEGEARKVTIVPR
jgi:spoIIIJ-associated protein